MADWIGALGSAGMLALLGLLVGAFLRQIGALRADHARRIGRAAVMTAAAGLGYLLAGMLMRQVVRGDVNAEGDLWRSIGGPYLHAALDALERPAWPTALTGAFAFLAHGLGTVLFHQYRLAGFALACVMTAASVLLLEKRLRAIADAQTAEDGAFLFLCLPGAAFFFLPCGAPLGLLIAAVITYFGGKCLPKKTIRYSRSGYGLVLAVCACLSAAVVFAVADGRIG